MRIVTSIGFMEIEEAKQKVKGIKKYLGIENIKTRIVPSDFNTYIWIEENVPNILIAKFSECFKSWEHEYDLAIARVEERFNRNKRDVKITPPKFL